MNKKSILKWGAGILLCIGAYAGAVEYWVWKWESPHLPLPQQHLTKQDQLNNSPTPSVIAIRAQQEMRDLAEQLQSVSMSGAMTIDGKLAWAGTVGLADVPKEEAATIETQYRIGSVSKSVTAIALMRMVEEGMIELDAPIHKYLPDYPRYSTQMTARQLVSHMAGVRHYGIDITQFPPTDAFSNVLYNDAIHALTQFKDDDLLFEPGQGFSYSTHGYTLLSAVMQTAGGKPFETLVKELVTQPLNLIQTEAEHLLKNKAQLANFYTSDDGLYGITVEQNLSNKVAGGGFVSTPSDLVTIGAALLDGSMLSKDSFDEMVKVQPMFDGSENPQYYALGWRHYETSRIVDENNKVDIIHHGGVAQGADSYFMLVPDHNIAVAITTNGQGDKSRREIQMLAYRLAGLVIKDRMQSQDEDTPEGVSE